MEQQTMSDAGMVLDERVALVRRNISNLMQQAAAVSCVAAEENLAARLHEQQDLLDRLLKEREALGQRGVQATASK
jgi:hypothetical protein